MNAEIADFLERWHRIVAERNLAALREVLADDVAIGAPPYWQRIAGRDVAHHLLGIIVTTIEGFTYHREWQQGRELALKDLVAPRMTEFLARRSQS